MNPNLFEMQVNPDGLEGHIEREQIRVILDIKDHVEKPIVNVESESHLPSWMQPKESQKEQKAIRRRAEIERLRESCRFYGVGCNKADCIKCRAKGIPVHKIKNLIEWM